MAWVAVAVAGSSLIGGFMSSSASEAASDAQSDAAAAQIAESRRQYNDIKELLKPYTQAGPGALQGQQNILGLGGYDAQRQAIRGIEESPQMAAMVKSGENAILQNASATGGLRGGNTQAALAQFRPSLLNQLIDQQYQRLGGLTTIGQNSAAGVGSAGQNASSSINSAYQQQGAAQAGNALAQGQAGSNVMSGLSQAAGLAFGSRPPTTGNQSYGYGVQGVSDIGGFAATPMFGDTSGFGSLGSGFYPTGY